ncbi:MAG TPA: hypothetical protein VG406_05355 [Isosphaeraceae bacterium]|nr:hypothetical protein [Isosphaeraceae bacterium]
MLKRPSRREVLRVLAFGLPGARLCLAQDDGEKKDAKDKYPLPPPIPEAKLLPTLTTTPVRRGETGANWTVVDATVLPKDRQGIWVLDFAFLPMRIKTVQIPGKGRRVLHYIYYRVINHTGAPRAFTPEFVLVTDTGKRYQDTVLPQAVKVIEASEDPTRPLLGAVEVMGMIPPSGKKEGIDDAVFGVAVWEAVDPKADLYTVYIRGLSDGMQELKPPDGGKPITRYKTLRLSFQKLGDDRDLRSDEIRLLDPPYEWIYW